MKKSMMTAIVAGLGLLLVGCATQSPCVGTWEAQADGEGLVLTLTEEGQMVYEHSGGDVLGGSWKIMDDGKFELTAEGEEQKAVVTLMDDDDLLFTIGGDSIKFTKQD